MATLGAIKRAAQAALDDGAVYLVTSAAAGTVTINNLIDATANASVHRYDGAWVYVSTGAGVGQQRRVTAGGFTPSTGTLALELQWSIVPSATNEIEITRLFPCAAGATVAIPPEDTDYRTLAVRALAKLSVPDRITLTFAGTSTASLSLYPWLDRPARLVRALEASPRSGYPDLPCEWRDPQLIDNGPTPVLQINRPFTGTLALEVLRPGHTLVDGGESTVGPNVDSSTVIPQVDDVLPQLMVEAYQALGSRSPGRPFPGADDKMTYWQDEAKKRRYYDWTTERPQAPAAGEAA